MDEGKELKKEKKKENSKETKSVKKKEVKESKQGSIKELEIILKKKQKEIVDLTDTLKRVQAEFINYKNRVEKENLNYKEYANENLIKNLLPLLDSFELALKQTDKKKDFVEGVELIYAQFINTLKQEGLIPIKAQGEKFDPYKHEVLLKQKSEQESETVIEELQKGYLYRGKVIRHSKVKISE
jgi:molecular chaperone GrpE